MANCYRATGGATGSATVGRAFELTTLWTFLLVLVCVMGSLGCKRSPHGEQNGESSAQRFREGKVIGGSMAPHFRGEHFVAQCNGCGSYFEGDFEQSKMAVSLICPFCGSQNSVTGRRGSDRVSIEVEPESISRWDVVAFQLPNIKQAGIKRVVGLPGESIEIRDGNLWLGGSLIRKTIDEQKCTRILIHDSNKTKSETTLWQPVDSQGARLDGAGHRFEGGKFLLDFQGDRQQAQGSPMQWFEFRNRRNYSHKADPDSADEEIEAWPIEDNYGYNQSLLRNLNVVDEIFVSLKLTTSGIHRLGWKYKLGNRSFVFEIDVKTRELTVTSIEGSTQKRLGQYDLAESVFESSEIEIEFSTIDKLAIVLLNGIQVAQFELETPAEDRVESKRAAVGLFQLGAAVGGGNSENRSPKNRSLGHVRIWRDIYYLPAQEKAQSQKLVAGSDGFLLLGDNQPVSIDSRHWPDAGVSREQLIGKVKKRRR